MKLLFSGLLWAGLTAVGLFVGLFVGLLVIGNLLQNGPVPAIFGIIILGGSIGLAQMVALLVLKQHFAIQWLTVTAIGFALFGTFFLWLDAFINVPDQTLDALQVGGGLLAAILLFVRRSGGCYSWLFFGPWLGSVR